MLEKLPESYLVWEQAQKEGEGQGFYGESRLESRLCSRGGRAHELLP